MKKWAEETFKVTDSLPMTELESPVETSLESIFRLAWWASDEARPAFRVDAVFEADWERTMLFAHQAGGQLILGSQESEARWAQVQCLARANAVLKTLPDHTSLELAISGGHPMRARGQMVKGSFQVESIHPAMGVTTLKRALELSRQAEEDDQFVAASEELAEMAETSLRQEWNMEDGSSPNLEREGNILRVKVDDDDIRSWMLMFGGHLLIHDDEFCQVWGLEEEREELQAEKEDFFAGLGLQIGQAVNRQAGIVTGKLIHEGKRSKYHSSDLRQSAWLRPEEVDLTDAALEPLGFTPIGDLVAEAFAGVVMRVYACREADCWAVVNAGLNRVFIREFFSQCQSGPCLTTTTLPFSPEHPDKKLYKVSLPELTWEDLLKAHRADLRQRAFNPKPCPKDLPTLAASIDSYLIRSGQ